MTCSRCHEDKFKPIRTERRSDGITRIFKCVKCGLEYRETETSGEHDIRSSQFEPSR